MKTNYIKITTPGGRNLRRYELGKSVADVEREFGITNPIKLVNNENPLGPSKIVLSACRMALPPLNIYPDDACCKLKYAISQM